MTNSNTAAVEDPSLTCKNIVDNCLHVADVLNAQHYVANTQTANSNREMSGVLSQFYTYRMLKRTGQI